MIPTEKQSIEFHALLTFIDKLKDNPCESLYDVNWIKEQVNKIFEEK
jgi:hypothetical protein